MSSSAMQVVQGQNLLCNFPALVHPSCSQLRGSPGLLQLARFSGPHPVLLHCNPVHHQAHRHLSISPLDCCTAPNLGLNPCCTTASCHPYIAASPLSPRPHPPPYACRPYPCMRISRTPFANRATAGAGFPACTKRLQHAPTHAGRRNPTPGFARPTRPRTFVQRV